MKSKRYRQDDRSDDEFSEHIKKCTMIESMLMDIYVKDLSRRTGKTYTVENSGIDNLGDFIPNSSNVKTTADFILITDKNKKRKIEIKFSRPEKDDFHLKVDQLYKYIDEDCCIVMFMAVSTPNIRYTIIKPDRYQEIINKYPKKYFWNKEQRQLKTSDFSWFKVEIPDEYKCLLQ